VEISLGEDERLGLAIVGGNDDPETDAPGCFVSELAEDAAASHDGRLKVGDQIISVNSQAMDPDAQHDDYVEALTAAVETRSITFKLRRVVPVDDVDWVTLFTSRHGLTLPDGDEHVGTVEYLDEGVVAVSLGLDEEVSAFGLALIGVSASENQGQGVYIAAVLAGGVAAEQGSLKQGQQVLELNGWNMSNASVDEANAIINAVANLTVVARPNPEGYMAFVSEAYKLYYSPLGDTKADKRTVVVQTTEDNRRLGMTICGPREDFAMVNAGVFVTDVLADTASHRSGLKAGDQILGKNMLLSGCEHILRLLTTPSLYYSPCPYTEVNGVSLSGASHGDAKRALMQAGTSVSLLVVHNPAGNEQFTLEADRLEAYADIYALPPMAPNAELEIPEVR
jgi:C-terminal processing protease CtpA/Prc